MNQLWTTSNLGRLAFSLRRDVQFYAPLLESLDFMGIDPVTYTYASGNGRIGRDGLLHNLAVNVPRFDFAGELPSGLLLIAGQTLQYSAQNNLHDANTLIWFESGVPKSTPTNPNPFSSGGVWSGSLSVYVKHITKMNRVLAASEINTIQIALEDVAQDIEPGLTPPAEAIGAFLKETPSGTVNGVNTTFTLSQNPNLGSVLLIAHGVVCERVAAAPGAMQYTLSGTGNKTITMGLAPAAGFAFWAQYVIGA